MSLPPYLLGPNPWATMMAQQHLAAAHAQAQAAAAAQAHAHALQQQMPPPHPKPDVMTEDKLQEKGEIYSLFMHKVYTYYFISTLQLKNGINFNQSDLLTKGNWAL